MICKTCGSPVPDGAEVCAKCGTPVDPSAQQKHSVSNGKKNAIGDIPRALIGALLGGLAFALLLGITGNGNTPASQPANANAGYVSAAKYGSDAADEGQYYIWFNYSDDSTGFEADIVKIESDGSTSRFYDVYSDDTDDEEEYLDMNGSPSSGLSLSLSEDEDSGSISVSPNSDGTLSGRVVYEGEEGYANTYTKFVPVQKLGNGQYKVLTTGEIVSYDDIEYDELDEYEVGRQFLRESAAEGNTLVEYDDDDSETPPTYSPVISTPPSTSNARNNAYKVPDEVMAYYVTQEVYTIEAEYQKEKASDDELRKKGMTKESIPVPQHLKMPNDTEQKRFESLVWEELQKKPEYLQSFYLANKSRWYK